MNRDDLADVDDDDDDDDDECWPDEQAAPVPVAMFEVADLQASRLATGELDDDILNNLL